MMIVRIRVACAEGRADVVQLLLQNPRVDVCACDHDCMRGACQNGHWAVVEALLSHKRISSAARALAIKRGIEVALYWGRRELAERLVLEAEAYHGTGNSKPNLKS